jgi:hypothetical protein
MKKNIIVLLLLLVFTGLQAQNLDIFNDCPREGQTNLEKNKILNFKKNRYEIPKRSDIDENVTMESLTERGNDEERFDENKAATIEGFIFDVTNTGKETCNCNAAEKVYQDVHIVIVKKKSYKSNKYHVVVEITPRLRAMIFEKLGVENNKELRNKIKGMKVKVTGWLLFDSEHKINSYNINPRGKKKTIWRATCWEIHPITNIELMED